MSATCQISIEAISSPPLWSWRGFLLRGNFLTGAILKMKASLHSFKSKSAPPPPDPGNSDNPPQSGESVDYWNDPMLWTLMFH
jgi:hypothetical protein